MEGEAKGRHGCVFGAWREILEAAGKGWNFQAFCGIIQDVDAGKGGAGIRSGGILRIEY